MDTETPFLSAGERFPSFLPCSNCGNEFEQTRAWSNFCSKECRLDFGRRMKTAGGPLAPLVLAWTETRHAKPGTREAAICNYARGEITAIARTLIDEIEDEGYASAVNYVERLMAGGFKWSDRRRAR